MRCSGMGTASRHGRSCVKSLSTADEDSVRLDVPLPRLIRVDGTRLYAPVAATAGMWGCPPCLHTVRAVAGQAPARGGSQWVGAEDATALQLRAEATADTRTADTARQA